MRTLLKILALWFVFVGIRHFVITFHWGIICEWQILLMALFLLAVLIVDTMRWCNKKGLEIIGYHPQFFWHWVFRKLNGIR